MSVALCIRVQDEGNICDIIKHHPMFPHCIRAVAVRHKGRGGNNPHFHIVGEYKGKRTDSATAWVRRSLGVGKAEYPNRKGNGFCSCKLWDGNPKAISYLFHEDKNAPLIIQHGFTDEYIEECRGLNLMTKAEMSDAKIRKKRIASELQDLCVAQLREWRKNNRRVRVWDIYRTYMELCKESQVNFPGKFQMEMYIRNIQASLTGDDPAELEKLYKSWYHEWGGPSPHPDEIHRPDLQEDLPGNHINDMLA